MNEPMEIKQTEESYVVAFLGPSNKLLVSIKLDGTVVIHEAGADKEAARVFYESLQLQGQTLFQRIATLEAESGILARCQESLSEVTAERDGLKAALQKAKPNIGAACAAAGATGNNDARRLREKVYAEICAALGERRG